MIGSGFPRLFLEHSPSDHFCAPCRCFFTNSHTLRCFFSRLSVVFCAANHFARTLLNILLFSSQVFFFCLSSFLLITSFWNSICVLSFLLSSFLSQRSSASPHSLGSQRKSPRISSINIVKDAMQARLQSRLWKSQTIRVGCELDLTTMSQRASCMYNLTFIRVTFALTGIVGKNLSSHKKKMSDVTSP